MAVARSTRQIGALQGRTPNSVEADAPYAATQLLQIIADDVVGLHTLDRERIVVIGIDGPTAAGKSMLAEALTATLRESGLDTWTLHLDWTLKERTEREADVAHLRQLDEAFEYEGELHMRLGLARAALESIASFNRQVVLGNKADQKLVLTELYSRAAGGTVTGKKSLTLRPGTVVVVDGHYTLRSELDILIDLNIVLLGEPKELVARKVNRVKGYRNPDHAVHYFWYIDLPSFNHHLARFGRNAHLIVDNTDYHNPQIVDGEAMSEWLRHSMEYSVTRPRRLESLADVPRFVFSESKLASVELGRILNAALHTVFEWDKMVGHYLRVAVEEVDEDLETLATRATENLNREFQQSPFRSRLSHTDALYRVYHRKLPLNLGLEIYDGANRTVMEVLAEVDRDSLRIGIAWQGGVKWILVERSLGSISSSAFKLSDGTPAVDTDSTATKLKVFLPTQFTIPSFLSGMEVDPVFIGREQENISASKVLSAILRGGGVWIHRFALHREIRFFQYYLDVEGVPNVHVGNYLIAVNTPDPGLRKRFSEFRRQWSTPIDRVSVTRTGHDAYDQVVDREKADIREYVRQHARRFAVKDGSLFGSIYDRESIDGMLCELGTLLRSPYRLLRKRTIDFLDQQFPGFALPTADLWSDVPEGAQRALSLAEFTGLSSSIMAEVYLWLALRDARSAVLGANVYDIRPTSVDARAFLEAAADRGCPVILQCSFNAVGQEETDGDKTVHGYLRPTKGVEDFTRAVRRSARDLYLLTGKKPPLYGIGLDHVSVAYDHPPQRARRFLHHALRDGGVTHIVFDSSDLFRLTATGRDELIRVYRLMSEWILDLMDSPLDTFLRDMEICISELNYIGGSQAYLPTTNDIRLFAAVYGDALARRGFAAHIARPKLFISNLGTRHHSADEVRPWVELSREWRDAVKGSGFVSAVLHGTSRSHQDTLSAATAGCHKVNVAGDFLETIVDNLPMRLSRTIQESDTPPKMMLGVIRPEMDRISDGEWKKLNSALKDHCSRVLKTISSPTMSSMDANYFQYRDYDFSAMQVDAILAAVRRELGHLMPKSPREPLDSRGGCAFAASMIEVPYEEFRGPVLEAIWEEGIRHFHIDAGDGVFISRRFSGVEKVRYLRENFPQSVIHAHLMVVNPHYPKDGEFAEIQQYAEAGADGIAFHIRACPSYREAVSAIKIIRRLNVRAGIVVETSDAVDDHLEHLIREQELDWVVVMGVPIGYGGQVFQYSTLNRIARLHDLAGRLGRDFLVECDGGLNLQNIELCRSAGGQLFSGWSVIKGQNVKDTKSRIRTVHALISKGE